MCLRHFRDLSSLNKWKVVALLLANVSYPQFLRAEKSPYVFLTIFCSLPAAITPLSSSFAP